MQVSLHSAITRLSALQRRPGSEQRGLKFQEIDGEPTVVGTVPHYHALQPVIQEFRNTVGYRVEILLHETYFNLPKKTSEEAPI